MPPTSRPKVYKNFGPARHRYTEAEKRARQRAENIAAPIVEEIRTEKLWQKRARRVHKKCRDLGITVEDQWDIRTMEGWQEPRKLRCPHRHLFERSAEYMHELKPSRNKSLGCPECEYKARYVDEFDPRMRLALAYDERGYRFNRNQYVNMHTEISVTRRADARTFQTLPKNAQRWMNLGKDKRVYVVETEYEDGPIFVWVGKPPVVRHPFIEAMLDPTNRLDTDAYFPNPTGVGATGQSGFLTAVKELAEFDRCVNMVGNPEWKYLDLYKWGKIEELCDYLRTPPSHAALSRYFQHGPEDWT